MLRRFSGLGAVVFAVVLLVGVARAHALAQAAGDDDLCVAMGGAGARPSAPPTEPTGLADGHHACCDLGLCLDGAALPAGEPPCAAARRVVRRGGRVTLREVSPRARRCAGHRPRGPPTL